MEMFNHVNSLILVTLVLVPGYLFARSKRKFCIFDSPTTWQEKVLYYIVHSGICFGASLSLFILSGTDVVGLLTKKDTAQIATELMRWPWLITVFINPLVFGFIAAMGVRFNLVGEFFNLFERAHGIGKFEPLKELDAWDQAFLRLNDGTEKIVAIQLKDGNIIYGVFDGQSCANRKGSYTDLFLSRALAQNSDGTLAPVPHSQGVFQRGSEIRSILILDSGAAGNTDDVPKPALEKDSADDQASPRSTL